MPKAKITSIDREVGAKIKAAREKTGMTLAQVAKKSGVSLQQIAKYEQGIARIYLARLVWIAKALGRSVTSFIDGIGGKNA
jgi:transcriptional regulator with XRE-family HTH domain